MRHILLYLSAILITMLSGCKKAPINSDVEGYWRMKQFTVISTGETVKCYDLFYGITRMVTEVSGAPQGTFISRTEYRDNETKLVLKDFMEREGTADNGIAAPVESLRAYGINSQEETVFSIEKCNGKTMILLSDYARIELEKF